ncbi:MAG: alkaline phosphatase [Zoogloea oleivorans]|jgi:alkaline phosphatase|uniref:Alkaline phosphatase n=1 Tax=Zoogloea oleivorans TaxID=1552750 RepID=A0A6C2CRR7_9RHOO|nr:alkaline phosphatase [Zoogloea oleivorans]MDY0035341.1 alkaline phosphatase [Zoogloea oleivorans]TYC56269.1 alkaline phosphatase [Zoogloea oleivorans]
MKTQLKLCAAALALVGATSAFAAGEATNVIFFLGDGMGPTTVTASRIYKYGEAGQLTMESLKRTARIKTYSLDGQTTDSAPSMAAYMTGVKMRNEVISMSAETVARDSANKSYTSGADSTCPAGNGSAVTTLLELAKKAGKSVGAVTTTTVTHATPAATYAHICNRNGENAIAAQAVPGGAGYNSALGNGVDVLLGGGTDHFLPTSLGGKRTDGRDLTAELKAQGYTYVNSGTAFKAVDTAATSKLVGLFNKSLLNYELDRAKTANAIDEPSLADMTEKAIKLLQKNGKGFFLMVEGGRIDHALHNTNAKRALEDTIAFDDAIKRALGLVDLKNTLVVVTADHDHTMTINGYSHKGNNILGKVTDIKKTTVQKTPVLATAGDSLPYTALVFGNGAVRNSTRSDLSSTDTAADDYYQEVGVKLGAAGAYPETHGGGDVMLFSSGAGSAGFKGTLDNTKVFGLVKSAMGL